MDSLTVAVEDPLNGDLDLLFERHSAHCHADTPPESMHMMDRAALSGPGLSLLVLRKGGQPIAMGALKTLGGGAVELKSMHVLQEARGSGAARRILDSLVAAAWAEGAQQICLETGSQPSFAPARALYSRAGFQECPPFANYKFDINSVFMKLNRTA